MAESRYEAEKKRACQWCASGFAPSERAFAEAQAIRAEEAERKLAAAEHYIDNTLAALEQERASLKAQMEDATVCDKCGGNASRFYKHVEIRDGEPVMAQSCPACKAGIVWPQEVKGG